MKRVVNVGFNASFEFVEKMDWKARLFAQSRDFSDFLVSL